MAGTASRSGWPWCSAASRAVIPLRTSRHPGILVTRTHDCSFATELYRRTSYASSFVWRSSTMQGRRMLLIAAPGQGAQAPGFLREWLELPGFAERLGPWSELAGCDLMRYGTAADADEIRDAAAAGVGAAAGHSVGELAAGVIAGALAPDDAIRLVRVRGQAMARAAAAEATGMTAVLGGDEPEVLAAIEASGLTPANVNGAGQIVAAGTVERLAAFAVDPPARARLRPLSVAGAFHTRHMGPAVDALREAAATVAVHSPALALLSNRDGKVVRSGPDWLERIVTQVSTPVRWD